MIDPDRIREFTEYAINAYNDNTVLDEIFVRREFDEERDKDLNFVQIGRRTTLPRKIFITDGNYHNGPVAEDFAKSVYLGERNYVLQACNESTKTSTATIDAFTYDKLVAAINQLDDATHIFLPLYFHETVHEWLEQDRLEFESGATYIRIGDSRVSVRWLPDKTGFMNIFVLDATRSELVQKRFNDMQPMDQIDVIEDYQFNEPDDRLMLYYGDADDDEEFSFIIRTVISEPIVTEDSACVVDTSNTDIELDPDEE